MFTASTFGYMTGEFFTSPLFDYSTISGTLSSSANGVSISIFGSYITSEVLSTPRTITAPAISGYNLAVASGTGSSTSSPSTSTSSSSVTATATATGTASCDFPTSAIASIAVTSFIGLIGILGFAVGACLFMRSRRPPAGGPPAGGPPTSGPMGPTGYYGQGAMFQTGGPHASTGPVFVSHGSPPMSVPSPEHNWSPAKADNAELSASPRPQDPPMMIQNFDYNHVPPHHLSSNTPPIAEIRE
ncbi:hypothetical protein GQ53DRAFT_755026 [Thozetella sp. PMI_491]|nr:hypothetical protein GQ53DRAFT_755026 [Thozetella sp. PMI_491]